LILGGGSCKFCQKCTILCSHPEFRAIPIEATGINVVATLEKMGLFLKFPVKKVFYRVGLLFWD
jgi:predicted metal-binding protein